MKWWMLSLRNEELILSEGGDKNSKYNDSMEDEKWGL